MFHIRSEILWKLIPLDLPARKLPCRSPGLQKFGACPVDIPMIENKILVDPRINSPLHIRIPKAPEISIPLFSPGWEELLPEVPKVPRDPRKRKKETRSLSLQTTTQNPTFPLLPDLSSSYEDLPTTSSHKPPLFPGLLKPIEQLLADPESNNLEEGEIPDTVSPVYSGEYWEPDLEIDLGSPVEHVEVEPDFINWMK